MEKCWMWAPNSSCSSSIPSVSLLMCPYSQLRNRASEELSSCHDNALRSLKSFHSCKERLMNAGSSCVALFIYLFIYLHLCICPVLISARHEPGQKVPSPKSCTQMTKIRTHKLLLEKCPWFNALRLLCLSCLDSVFPNVWGFYRCLCIADNCHLLIDCTLPKYFKLSACILVPFILSASISAECFILPCFSCVTFYDSSSLYQNKASGLKQGSALWLNISF